MPLAACSPLKTYAPMSCHGFVVQPAHFFYTHSCIATGKKCEMEVKRTSIISPPLPPSSASSPGVGRVPCATLAAAAADDAAVATSPPFSPSSSSRNVTTTLAASFQLLKTEPQRICRPLARLLVDAAGQLNDADVDSGRTVNSLCVRLSFSMPIIRVFPLLYLSVFCFSALSVVSMIESFCSHGTLAAVWTLFSFAMLRYNPLQAHLSCSLCPAKRRERSGY